MNFKKGFNSHEHYLCVNMQFKKKTVDWKKYTTVLKGGEFKIKIKQHSNKWKPKNSTGGLFISFLQLNINW